MSERAATDERRPSSPPRIAGPTALVALITTVLSVAPGGPVVGGLVGGWRSGSYGYAVGIGVLGGGIATVLAWIAMIVVFQGPIAAVPPEMLLTIAIYVLGQVLVGSVVGVTLDRWLDRE
ncbi:hypothetical protein [Halococcoides cellulosivorans]|nr:hypothetical protein [Halococcoides cellulosivorans]